MYGAIQYAGSQLQGIVLEYMSGGTLHRLLHGAPPDAIPAPKFATDIACRTSREIASGLAYLHANGYMHRDVKSSNVLLNDNLHAKVSDFSIAKFRAAAGQATPFETDPTLVQWDSRFDEHHTFGVGTPRYMAPVLLRALERCLHAATATTATRFPLSVLTNPPLPDFRSCLTGDLSGSSKRSLGKPHQRLVRPSVRRLLLWNPALGDYA